MILRSFRTWLTHHLDEDALSLPLSREGEARLLQLLAYEGESILLVLRDDRHEEEIEVGITCGKPVVWRRGIGHTRPRRFPRGTEAAFRVTVEAVKHLICTWDCCREEPCECEEVRSTGVATPPGAFVGVPVSAAFSFEGTAPIVLTWEAPHWLGTSRDARNIEFRGVPPAPGPVTITVHASNCRGRASAERSVQFTVASSG
jgi:hypothetical protein